MSALKTNFIHSGRSPIISHSLWLFVAALLVCSATSSKAQWSVVKTFSQQVECVYFLDQLGAPSTGFVGLYGGAIYKTTDNGATWTAASTPSSFNNIITQFAFKSTLVGWCSEETFNGQSGNIWATTDGGLTWSTVSGTTGTMVSVGYSPASGELIAINWNLGSTAIQSSNLGASWTSFAQPIQNGVTFGGNGMSGTISTRLAPGFLYTTDGGVTWRQPSPNLDVESWSPFQVPGDQHVFAACERSQQVFVSANGGASWTNTYTFGRDIYPTGCIMGSLNSMYVQTDTLGFYCSTDQGITWISICGPSNERDTRFYAKPSDKEIFAGDGGDNLWYNPNATSTGSSTLSLDKSAIAFSGTQCGTTDSIIHISANFNCIGPQLTKAQILTGSPYFSIPSLSLPITLESLDSIIVMFSPLSTLKDTGSLLLEFNLGSTVVDTVIKLSGISKGSVAYNHVPSISFSLPYACETKDSTLVLFNFSCDTLTITGETLSDSSVFKLLPFKLPYALAPYDTAFIPFYASPQHDGNFTSTLKLRMIGGTNDTVNDQIPLSINILQGAEAVFGALDVSVLNGCTALDTIFPILDTKCDSIVLLSASLSDTTYFHLGTLALPGTIRASGELDLPVHVSPPPKGTYTSILKLKYLSGQSVVDTSITLTYSVEYEIPQQVGLSATVLEMGTVGAPCAQSAQYLYFTNTLCRPLTIDGISWDSTSGEYSFTPIVLPLALAANGGTDSVLVHFKPDTASASSNMLRISLELDGVQFDTVLTVTGTGVSTYHDTLLTQSLNFDSLSVCQTSELDGEIVNLSCNSVIATSATIAGDNGYTVVSPTFPQTMQTGDTLHIRFALDPKQSGEAVDSAILTIHNPSNDSDYTHTIFLNAEVGPNDHQILVEPNGISSFGMQPCSTLDTSILIQNLGNCDNVIISTLNISGDGALILDSAFSLPDTLPPGSSARVYVRIAPLTDSVKGSSIEIAGMNIYAAIPFGYSSLPGAHSVSVLAADSVFNTRPCVPVVKTFSIANTGCDPLTLDSVTLAQIPNETEFGLQGIPSFPIVLPPNDTLSFSVQFDPNGSGNGNCGLDINSHEAGFSRTVSMTGNVIGTVPSARVELGAGDGTKQASCKAGDTISISALLLDDIGDSTNLTTVSILLNANWDLLAPTVVTTAPGWSILTTAMQPGGLYEVRLHHDIAGAVLGNTVLATIYFYTYISDSDGCYITMSNLQFNDSVPNYESCVLASIDLPDTVRYTTIDTCGTPILRRALDGNIAFRIIAINPNPVPLSNGSAQADMTFNIAAGAAVTVVVRDMIGREISRTSDMFTSGGHTVRLSLPSNAEGSYFVEAESGGVRDVRNIVIEGK